MNYKKMLELYQENKLDEAQKKQLEEEIEKQSAISEYLFEHDFENWAAEEDKASERSTASKPAEADKEKEFINFVQKSIRKTFWKIGFAVGTTVLVAVLLLLFLIPKAEKKRYYNPAECIEEETTQRIDLDMYALTELFLPGRNNRSQVDVVAKGGSSYDIIIRQYFSYSGMRNDYIGSVQKGKLMLYTVGYLDGIPLNVWSDALVAGPGGRSFQKFKKTEAFAEVEELDETKLYVAYVTLNKVMNYTEFSNWTKSNNISGVDWCKLCFHGETLYEGENRFGVELEGRPYYCNGAVGFSMNPSVIRFRFDGEKYPSLLRNSLTTESEETVKEHVISTMRYLSNQKKFLKMIGWENATKEFGQYIADIEKYGLSIYGFMMMGKKQDLCALKNIAEIDFIDTKIAQYE